MSVFNWRSFAPKACIHRHGEGDVISLWNGSDWQAADELPPASLFGQTLMLVAEDMTCFRLCTFPADLIDGNALAEAVALDAEAWSPWGASSASFYWPVHDGDQWRVAVWTWDAAIDCLPAEKRVTHILPESAWRIATARCLNSSVLLVWPSADRFTYASVDASGMPLHVASVRDRAEGLRFWRGLGSQAGNITRTLLLDGLSQSALPWSPDIPAEQAGVKASAPSVLKRARRPGVQDWTDPFAWRRPMLALLLLWLLWLAGSSAILWERNSIVDATLEEARTEAEGVLALRERVRRLSDSLEALGAKRQRQARELRFLAALSEKLPKDAWLLSMVHEGQRVDIQGRAKHAAEIGALLETIPGIDHLAYLGDVRPDAASGRESFHMRLHFAEADE